MDTLELYKEIEQNNINLIETKIPIENLKGLYFDNNIVVDTSVSTTALTNCILAEELGHYHTSNGNILKENTFESIKQEQQARNWAVNRLISLDNLIKALKDGVSNINELAEYLDVTEEFIIYSIDYFKKKYGLSVKYKGYLITFSPNLYIKKLKE